MQYSDQALGTNSQVHRLLPLTFREETSKRNERLLEFLHIVDDISGMLQEGRNHKKRLGIEKYSAVASRK